MFNFPRELELGVNIFGVVTLVSFAWTLLSGLWRLVRPSKVRSFGPWAVVTGATDGIGLAYCHEFASKGINVVLISRTQARLDSAKDEIQKAHPGVEVKTIQADFDSEDPKLFQKIEKQLGTTAVGILVNNVGRSYDHAEYFDQIDDELAESLIRMNIVATTRMTKLVLPGMLARKKGAIVNVGSAAGLIHSGDPLYAVYSGTKAYVDFFSRSLNLEYKAKGIHVQCQVPYFVPTKLSKIRHASLAAPSAKDFAKAAVASIGYEASIVPYPIHAIQHFLIQEVLPGFLFVPFLLKHHFGIRRAALKKKEAAKSK